MMPYKYAVECVCDKIAATRTYNGKSYTPDKALLHWDKYGSRVNGNPKTMLFIRTVFLDMCEGGEKRVLNKKYMRETFNKICG